MTATGERRLQAIWIDGDHPVEPADMEFITPAEAAALIEHSARVGGAVEIYLTGSQDEWDRGDDTTPFIGLVFEDGIYTKFGLGDCDETRSFESRVGEPIDQDDFEAWVNS